MQKPVKRSADKGLSRVVIDFDGTLATDTWPKPSMGDPITSGVDLVKHYAKKGYEVVIYTARPESHRLEILCWLSEHGLDDYIYDVICGKPQAWLYIDDRAWNPWRIENFDC